MKKSTWPTLAFLALALSSPMSAKFVARNVDYQQGGVQLQGYLVYDDARTAMTKLPGVLVVPEWWGVNDYVKSRATQLAALGYVAFVVDMYGKGIVTTDAKKATELSTPFYGSPLMAARAQAGLDQLLATDLADPRRIAAIGYCFGGSTVQALAYTGAPLAGVVSFHGGLIPVPADAKAKTQAKLLILQGAADPFVPKKDRDTFVAAMDEGKFDYQFVSYAGAVHAFTNPDADKMAQLNGLEGKIGYNASADHRSWAAMQAFFTEIFARPPQP
jgi:dienelactone hydrolase